MPVAEAWEAATSYPDFAWDKPAEKHAYCSGLSCVLAGAAAGGSGCQFRCYDAPAEADDAQFPASFLRVVGPVLGHGEAPGAALKAAALMSREAAVQMVVDSGLRGRGGAYFPVGQKWRSALSHSRPVALVVNAEEGEPGVFKDRAILGTRPLRFIEGLGVAQRVLEPAVTVVFINGEARAARRALEVALAANRALLASEPMVIAGAGGYVLGEESALLNAIEGRKPVPRVRPPYPVDSGLFGMPTVVNNVESITNLAFLFGDGLDAFRAHGTAEAPGTKLFSVSGRVQAPGLYEVDLGTTVAELAALAGGASKGPFIAALCGGPSGGFLPPAEFDRALLPGPVHPTGAVAGSGGIVFLDSTSDLRAAAIAMAAYNAAESCGKCTPCREGTPRALDAFRGGQSEGLDDLLEIFGTASLCGLGTMAPAPIRSARHFWPELFP